MSEEIQATEVPLEQSNTDLSNESESQQQAEEASVDIDNSAESESVEQEQVESDKGEQGEIGSEDDDTPFPKKAKNAINSKNKKIARQAQQLNELREQLKQYEVAKQPEVSVDSLTDDAGNEIKAPKEDDYEQYQDYLKDLGKYEAKVEYAQQAKQREVEAKANEEQAWIAERTTRLQELSNEAVKVAPELESLYIDNEDIVASYPNYIKQAILGADNGHLAFYALAKEGKLEELGNMSQYEAIKEIVKAEERGESLVQRRPVSKAPKTTTNLKTKGSTRKSVMSMTDDEFLKMLP